MNLVLYMGELETEFLALYEWMEFQNSSCNTAFNIALLKIVEKSEQILKLWKLRWIFGFEVDKMCLAESGLVTKFLTFWTEMSFEWKYIFQQFQKQKMASLSMVAYFWFPCNVWTISERALLSKTDISVANCQNIIIWNSWYQGRFGLVPTI